MTLGTAGPSATLRNASLGNTGAERAGGSPRRDGHAGRLCLSLLDELLDRLQTRLCGHLKGGTVAAKLQGLDDFIEEIFQTCGQEGHPQLQLGGSEALG